jgi:hypothetical protein
MSSHEILPSPENKNASVKGGEAVDGANEKESSQAVEQKPQAAKDGSGLMSAAAVNNAQQQVQGASNSGQDDGAIIVGETEIEVPDVAEDVDLIEKEWVKKAKDIVNATYGDPYTQNKQISKMKIEYIKKRYDREIKARDE